MKNSGQSRIAYWLSEFTFLANCVPTTSRMMPTTPQATGAAPSATPSTAATASLPGITVPTPASATTSAAATQHDVHFDWSVPTPTFLSNEWSLLQADANANRPPAEEGRNWPLLRRQPRHWADTINHLDIQHKLYGQLRSLFAYCEAHEFYPAPMEDLVRNIRTLRICPDLLAKCEALEREVAIDVVARSGQCNPQHNRSAPMDIEFCRGQYVQYKDILERDRLAGGYDYLANDQKDVWATSARDTIEAQRTLLNPVATTGIAPFVHGVSAFGHVVRRDSAVQTSANLLFIDSEDIEGAPLPPPLPPTWSMPLAASGAAAIEMPAAAAAAADIHSQPSIAPSIARVQSLSEALVNFPTPQEQAPAATASATASAIASASASASAAAPAAAAPAAMPGVADIEVDDSSDEDFDNFLVLPPAVAIEHRGAAADIAPAAAAAIPDIPTAADTETDTARRDPWRHYVSGVNVPQAPVLSGTSGSLRPQRQDPSQRNDPANIRSLMRPILRAQLTQEEANALQRKEATEGRRDIFADDDLIEGFEVPAGTDMNTVPVWRMTPGFHYLQWTLATGIGRIAGTMDQYTVWKLNNHKRNESGPIYTKPEDDPVEGSHGGYRLQIHDLPPGITPNAIVDLLRLDIAALSDTPNFVVPEAAFCGPVSVRMPPSAEMRGAYVTAINVAWATAMFDAIFLWQFPHPRDAKAHYVKVHYFHPRTRRMGAPAASSGHFEQPRSGPIASAAPAASAASAASVEAPTWWV